MRCNLQIEGSGVIPEDVLIDARHRLRASARPAGQAAASYAKHVVMRTDRTDGFVVRNMLFKGALEHGFYTEETDGILLDKVKFFWDADYGHLSFTTDHNVIQNCEAFGSGDAGVYPGASPQTGDFREKELLPREAAQHDRALVRPARLDARVLGLDGQLGAHDREPHLRQHRRHLERHALGARAIPGFPADGMQIDHNYIYSNNLDLYGNNPPVKPLVPMPIGTGIVWPGMNGGKVYDNYIFDNWRHGTLLAAVPDEVAGSPEGNVDPDVHCTNTTRRQHLVRQPVLGQHHGPRPAGLQLADGDQQVRQPERLPQTPGRCPTASTSGGTSSRATTATAGSATPGPTAREGSVTGPGDRPPAGRRSRRTARTAAASGDVVKEGVLVDCVTWYDFHGDGAYPLCYWFRMPPQPGSSAARSASSRAGRPHARSGSPPAGGRLRAASTSSRAAQRSPGAMADRWRARATLGAVRLRGRLVAGCGGDADQPKPRPPQAARREARRLGRAAGPLQGLERRLAPRSSPRSTTRAQQVNRDDTGIDSPPLSDEEATKLFDRACANTYAPGFRLYVIYARAAGFAPLLREVQR